MANHVYFHIDTDCDTKCFNDAFVFEKVERRSYSGDKTYMVNELVMMEHQPFYKSVDKTFDKGWCLNCPTQFEFVCTHSVRQTT